MAISQSPNVRDGSRGFTLIETLVAILVLSVGLLSLAALATQMLSGTARSHFSSLAADLASEKLEDLSRWPSFDPNVYAASGTTVGSLTSDSSATVTSGGIPAELVNYYDDVDIADLSGAISETVSVVSGGSTSFKTTTHNPDGTISITTNSSAPSTQGAIAFHRRWTIEMDQPVTGTRRITVLVSLQGQLVQPPVSFQMTTVRP
jgi:type IV pilus modification protein PilV